METFTASEDVKLKHAEHLQTFIAENGFYKVDDLYEMDGENFEQYEEAIWYSPTLGEFFRYGETSHVMESFGDYWRGAADFQRGDLLWAVEVAQDMGYSERFMEKLKELSYANVIQATAKQFYMAGIIS